MDLFLPIKENRDFRRMYARGKSYVSPALVTYVMRNRTGSLRVGITTSKKVGNAVKRSRSRRVIREAFRMCACRVKPGYDFVFVARGKTPFVKSTDLFKSMEKQLRDLSSISVLSRFVGMLTDSRSFLSYPRHEYFRRILCRVIGGWVEDGQAPADYALLGSMVQDICYNNVAKFIGIEG